MATLKFILRGSARGEEYSGKLCARIIHARKVRLLTSPLILYQKEWDEAEQKILLPGEDDPRYNTLLKYSTILLEYQEQFSQNIEILESKGRYDIGDILHTHQSRRGLSSLSGFSHYLSHNLTKSGQERTARAYLTACRALIAFNKGQDLPLKHINTCLIKAFEHYLKERGKAMNTISYYMRMLRAIYHKAIAQKLIPAQKDNPFAEVFTGFEETTKRALDIEQLRQLHELDFSKLLEETPCKSDKTKKKPKSAAVDQELYTSWRYFFFCFHARGMSFVDLAYLRKDNIRQGIISYYRKKTGKKIEVGLSPILQKIIDSFSKETAGSPFLFPIIKDPHRAHRLQYETGLKLQNKRLKKLGELAGINPRWGLSTHVSRHSWATTGKMQNLPLSVISEGLGHRSERTTSTYLASFDRSTMDQASAKIDLAIMPVHSTTYLSAFH